jgi:hypothetical protein
MQANEDDRFVHDVDDEDDEREGMVMIMMMTAD